MSYIFKLAMMDKNTPDESPQPEKRSSSVFSREENSDGLPEEEDNNDLMIPQETKNARVLRNANRYSKDVLTTAVGIPGGLLSLANDYIAGPIASKITGKSATPYEKTPLSILFPTSQMIRKSERDQDKPKTAGEATASEWIQDVTNLAIPLPGSGKAAAAGRVGSRGINFLKRLGARLFPAAKVATGGMAAKHAAKELGVSEENAQKIKMATVFLGGIAAERGGGVDAYRNSLYADMRQARPQNATIRSPRLISRLQQERSRLLQGGTASSSTAALRKIDELIDITRNGRGVVHVEELEGFGRKINELKSGLYNEFGSDRAGRNVARANLDRATRIVENTLDEYAATNPRYGHAREMAQEAHGAIQNSKQFSDFLKRNAKTISKGTAGGILIEAMTNPAAIVPTIGGGLASLAGLKGAEVIARIMTSPVLAQYYSNMLAAGINNNISFFNANLEKLNKAIENDPDLLLHD